MTTSWNSSSALGPFEETQPETCTEFDEAVVNPGDDLLLLKTEVSYFSKDVSKVLSEGRSTFRVSPLSLSRITDEAAAVIAHQEIS